MLQAVLFEFGDPKNPCKSMVTHAIATARRVIERLGVTVASSDASSQFSDTHTSSLDRVFALSEEIMDADIVVVGATLDADSTSPYLERFVAALESDDRVDDDTGQRLLYGKVFALAPSSSQPRVGGVQRVRAAMTPFQSSWRPTTSSGLRGCSATTRFPPTCR